MTHDPDERARQLLARALTLEPDDDPPADFVDAVMRRLPPPPSPGFERGLTVAASVALAGVAAWAGATQPGVAAALHALRELPAAPVLAWVAAAFVLQALLQARRGTRP